MKINPKLTGALAWTGLVLVLAVPAADMLGGKPEARANLTSDMEQVQAATVQPAAKPMVPAIEDAAATDDPVSDFVKSGKKLPSYISGNDAPVVDEASTPKAPAKKPGTITVNADGTIEKPVAAPAKDDATVASIKPELVAPVPLPLSARPKSFPSTTTLPAPTEQPLIIDETTVASTGPVPPADIAPDDQLVTGDELEEWDTGSLADYLERKGLMSDASAPNTREYDADGFFLSDGPNRQSRSRVIWLEN